VKEFENNDLCTQRGFDLLIDGRLGEVHWKSRHPEGRDIAPRGRNLEADRIHMLFTDTAPTRR
jgi:hypothetical protein